VHRGEHSGIAVTNPEFPGMGGISGERTRPSRAGLGPATGGEKIFNHFRVAGRKTGIRIFRRAIGVRNGTAKCAWDVRLFLSGEGEGK
jgi:hypothetical protein